MQDEPSFLLLDETCRPARERLRGLLLTQDGEEARWIRSLAVRSKQLDIRMETCLWPQEAFVALVRRPFDLIYVDFWLGFETAAAFVCECARRNDAPVVVLNGFDDPSVRRLAFRAGARACLAKDELSTQALDAVTLAVLGGRADRAETQG